MLSTASTYYVYNDNNSNPYCFAIIHITIIVYLFIMLIDCLLRASQHHSPIPCYHLWFNSYLTNNYACRKYMQNLTGRSDKGLYTSFTHNATQLHNALEKPFMFAFATYFYLNWSIIYNKQNFIGTWYSNRCWTLCSYVVVCTYSIYTLDSFKVVLYKCIRPS